MIKNAEQEEREFNIDVKPDRHVDASQRSKQSHLGMIKGLLMPQPRYL